MKEMMLITDIQKELINLTEDLKLAKENSANYVFWAQVKLEELKLKYPEIKRSQLIILIMVAINDYERSNKS